MAHLWPANRENTQRLFLLVVPSWDMVAEQLVFLCRLKINKSITKNRGEFQQSHLMPGKSGSLLGALSLTNEFENRHKCRLLHESLKRESRQKV